MANELNSLYRQARQSPQAANIDVPEFTQEYIDWHTQNYGPIVNTQVSSITYNLKVGENKASRHTHKAVAYYISSGYDAAEFIDIIKEGIFLYTKEMIAPTMQVANSRVIEPAERIMLEHFYAHNLVRA